MGRENTAALAPEPLAAALNSIRVGVEVVDCEGRRVYVSEVGRALSATPPETVVVDEDGCELQPDSRCHMRVLKSRTAVRDFVYALPGAHGGRRWVSCSGLPLHEDAGVSGALMVMLDVTEQHETIPALRRSEHQFRTIVEMANQGIAVYDTNGRVAYANDRMTDINGYSRAEMLGKTVGEFTGGSGGQALLDADMDRWRRGISKQTQARISRADGSALWVMISSNPLVDEAGEFAGGVSMMTDLSELKAAEAALTHQALYDGLTGIPNRVLFMDRLEHELASSIREGTRFALLMFDLDHFKDVNDTHGHRCGDLLLQGVAQRLSGVFRASDTFARLGGDEFAAVLPGCSTTLHGGVVIDKVKRALDEPFDLEGRRLLIRTSVGLALFPENGADADTLLEAADAAMYEAKRRRPGRQTR